MPEESDEPAVGRFRRLRAAVRARRRPLLAAASVLGALVLVYVVVAALTWPDVAALRGRNPERTAFIDRYVDRNDGAPVAWSWVPASRISPYLKEAVVVSEDLEFFSHDGFSRHEIEQAIRKAVEELRPPRGASTITQQLAKNLWLSPSRNPLRKGKEVILTRQLEKHLGKNRILEVYLNVVEFGPGVYGAEAAARRYFGKSAASLAPREAAQLAAGLPRPRQWHPGVGSASYARRVETVLARMQQVTFLDDRFGVGGEPEPETIRADEPVLPPGDSVVPDAGPADTVFGTP